MNLFDKLLLLLLILILPVGLLATRLLLSESDIELAESGDGTEQVTVAELEALLEQVANRPVTDASSEAASDFTITSVINASESGVLRVAGIAPDQSLSIMVSATVLPPGGSQTPAELGQSDESDQNVLGRNVEVKAITVKPGGSFLFEYDISDMEGIVEMRLEQGSSSSTIQYDLTQNKQIL